MNIQMLAACVDMRKAWYKLVYASRKDDINFDLLTHITAQRNKIEPNKVTKEARLDSKASIFTSMYFEVAHNDKEIPPAVLEMVDNLLAGMFALVSDKDADISFGTLLDTTGDLHHALFECIIPEERNDDLVRNYFEVSEMREFLCKRAEEDCVTFNTFVKEFWKNFDQLNYTRKVPR